MENKDKFNQIAKLTKEETERLFSEAEQNEKEKSRDNENATCGYDKEKGEAYLLHHDRIVEIGRNSFDYTKWRREYFDKMKPGEFSEEAIAYAKAHSHKGKGQRL